MGLARLTPHKAPYGGFLQWGIRKTIGFSTKMVINEYNNINDLS